MKRKHWLGTTVFLLAMLLVGSLSAWATPKENLEFHNFVAPPSNFNALTASNDELTRFGLPKRPNVGTAEFEIWKKAVVGSKRVDSNPVAIPGLQFGLTTSTSHNYAGYRVTDPGTYTSATTVTYVPAAASSASQVMATWAGLHTAPNIIQAGAANSDSVSTTPYFWFEDYPGPAYKITGLTAHNGDQYYILVSYDSSTHNASYYISDFTTGQYTNGTFSASYVGNTDVEYILENPTLNYPNIGSVTFQYCGYNRSGTSGGLGDGATNITKFIMVNSSNSTVYSPGSVSFDTNSFTVTHS
ncbi:G1 family glutamic endopeptidase [Cohnella zeiphila]|uniref:Peptidase A4 family protein n=1 Tax=Cohnella zeiphila TaxID=2761120 RepID=A0A7X0SMH0_9BACL|nr:G1 family glutamic endopeptidase [Cohnella zeiphila]MBB6732718.1 hypothetical protein [Cohnella zeiphila]